MQKSTTRGESTYVYQKKNGKDVLTKVIAPSRDALNHLIFYVGRYHHQKKGTVYVEDKTKVMMIEVYSRGNTYREAVRNWIRDNPPNEIVVDALAGLLWMGITPLDLSTYLLVASPAKKVTRYSLMIPREDRKMYDFQMEKRNLILDFYPLLVEKLQEYAIEKETAGA